MSIPDSMLPYVSRFALPSGAAVIKRSANVDDALWFIALSGQYLYKDGILRSKPSHQALADFNFDDEQAALRSDVWPQISARENEYHSQMYMTLQEISELLSSHWVGNRHVAAAEKLVMLHLNGVLETVTVCDYPADESGLDTGLFWGIGEDGQQHVYRIKHIDTYLNGR